MAKRVALRWVAAAVAIVGLMLADAIGNTGMAQVRLAQAVTVPDGKFASVSDFLYGTWVWERQSPRQTMQMRFSRNSNFFYNNFTLGLTHYGRFSATAEGIRLTIQRSCTKNGQQCGDRQPALVLEYPIRPTKTGEFYSNDEQWVRTARE